MIKIKDNYVAYIIIFSFIFAFPFFSYAQNIANNVKPVLIAAAEVTKQTIKKENPSANEVNPKKEDSSFFNFNSSDNSLQPNGVSEEKQDIMEKALELLETADKLSKTVILKNVGYIG